MQGFVHLNHDNQGCSRHALLNGNERVVRPSWLKPKKDTLDLRAQLENRCSAKCRVGEAKASCGTACARHPFFARGKREAHVSLPPRAWMESHET